MVKPVYIGAIINDHRNNFDNKYYYLVCENGSKYTKIYYNSLDRALEDYIDTDDRGCRCVVFDPEFNVVIYSSFWEHDESKWGVNMTRHKIILMNAQ